MNVILLCIFILIVKQGAGKTLLIFWAVPKHTANRLSSIFHWYGGPFLFSIKSVSSKDHHSLNYCNRLLSENHSAIFIFDNPKDHCLPTVLPSRFFTHPLELREWLNLRYKSKVNFVLDKRYSHPIELRWAQFRGNTNLVPLGDKKGTSLILWPGRKVVQYAHPGHLFASMDIMLLGKNVIEGNNSVERLNLQQYELLYENDNKEFDRLIQLDRVNGLYLVPATHSDEKHEVEVDFVIKPYTSIHSDKTVSVILKTKINKKKVESISTGNVNCGGEMCTSIRVNQCCNRTSVYEGALAACEDESNGNKLHLDMYVNRSNKVYRNCLLKYWEFQRLVGVNVHTWAAPSLLTATAKMENCENYNSTDHFFLPNSILTSTETKNMWKNFHLPDWLTKELKSYHRQARSTTQGQGSSKEPPISMVFNQHKVDTLYVPILERHMNTIKSLILNETIAWMSSQYHSINQESLRNKAKLTLPQLEVTGAYGSREYGPGAVVRWHVDPIETQPITAIIHIAEEHSTRNRQNECKTNENTKEGYCKISTTIDYDKPKRWALQIPKYINYDEHLGTAWNEESSGIQEITNTSRSECADSNTNNTNNNNNNNNNSNNNSNNNYNSIKSSSESNLEGNNDCDLHDSDMNMIYLEEGEVVLLLSGQLPHARICPYEGLWYANAFVHLAPVGWEQRPDIMQLRF